MLLVHAQQWLVIIVLLVQSQLIVCEKLYFSLCTWHVRLSLTTADSKNQALNVSVEWKELFR